MKRRLGWIPLAAVLAITGAGCSDFSQHHFGGVRSNVDLAQIKPTPQPALTIPDPPPVAQGERRDNDKPAVVAPKADAQVQPLRLIYQRAAQQVAAMDAYSYHFTRREVVNGVKQPEEIMVAKIRREPYSVYLKWLGPQGKGREVVYVHGKFDNEMQILTAAGDLPFFPGGSRMSFAPTSTLVTSKTRYPITSTGLGSLVERFGRLVAAAEKGDERSGTAKYLGKQKRPEFEAEVEVALQTLAAGADPSLPKGGQRWWCFDATGGLPVLIIAHDADGEVEYYRHEQIQPVRLNEDDFQPDRLWRK